MKKKENQEFALKLVLMTALNIYQDMLLRDVEGKDRISNKKLLQLIKVLQD